MLTDHYRKTMALPNKHHTEMGPERQSELQTNLGG